MSAVKRLERTYLKIEDYLALVLGLAPDRCEPAMLFNQSQSRAIGSTKTSAFDGLPSTLSGVDDRAKQPFNVTNLSCSQAATRKSSVREITSLLRLPPFAVRRIQVTRPTFNEPCNTPSAVDYFVGSQENGLGDDDTERLCGFQVDHELELGRSLDREFAAPCALHNLVRASSGAPK